LTQKIGICVIPLRHASYPDADRLQPIALDRAVNDTDDVAFTEFRGVDGFQECGVPVRHNQAPQSDPPIKLTGSRIEECDTRDRSGRPALHGEQAV
jgi:hypothetical protein